LTALVRSPETSSGLALDGRVVGLARDGRNGFSKSAMDTICLIQGQGVEGDAHSGPFVRHRYLARRQPRLPNLRQVHLIPSELFEALRNAGYDLHPGDLGDNIATAGLDLETLPMGALLDLGSEACIELTGLRTPCVLIDRFRTGLKRQMVCSEPVAPRFRCGVMSIVRTGGRLAVGDPIRVRLPPKPWTDLPAV